MNILLTNDDGYDALGIRETKKILEKYGRVVIVAPLTAMSGKSTSITLGKALELKEYEKDVYSFDGTPADCVAFGLSMFDIEFDLVVSGCNKGWNVSYDTMYSGTIGACLQAMTFRKPAIALSCEDGFSLLQKYGGKVLDYIFKNKLLSDEYLLNVNFPLGEEVADIQISELFYRNIATFYIKSENGYEGKRRLNDEYKNYDKTDVYMVRNKMISITPLSRSFYNEKIYQDLQNKIKHI